MGQTVPLTNHQVALYPQNTVFLLIKNKRHSVPISGSNKHNVHVKCPLTAREWTIRCVSLLICFERFSSHAISCIKPLLTLKG